MAKTVCVYCASSVNLPEKYYQAARDMGRVLVVRGHTLVYGGGNAGMMGELARTVLDGGGRVTGVIPHALKNLELALESVTEMIVTDGMHERKAIMAERADAFIALPGGFGTFEEITEIITHRQLGIHDKPCILVSIGGYYSPLVEQFEMAFRNQFTHERHRRNYAVAGTVQEAAVLLDSFFAHRAGIDHKPDAS